MPTVRGTINSPLWQGAGQYARVSHCISVLQSAPAKGAQPQHLRDPHLGEDALYETAAGPCLGAALGTWCGRVYRWGTEGLYADTDRVLVSACSLDRPDDPAVFVAISVEPADHPTLSMGTRAEMAEPKAPPHTVKGTA